MTKEQRAESRAICELAYVRDSKIMSVPMTKSAILFAKHAITALPAALDALDEAERRADVAEGVLTVIKQCRKNENERWVQCAADRAHWKAYAEALERAIKYPDYLGACYACKNRDGECKQSGCEDNFKFDQARFAPGDGKDAQELYCPDIDKQYCGLTEDD